MDASPIAAWDNFYVIVGSSAGALTGLQFVVIALIAESRATSSMLEIRAFGTPTVVHFCAALLVSAVLTAPWHGLSGIAICLAACGLAGELYSASVIRHARRQTGYNPDAEDWAWYIVIPLFAYAALVISAALLRWHTKPILFLVAATAITLLFTGIHNSWDTVTYIAVRHFRHSSRDEEER